MKAVIYARTGAEKPDKLTEQVEMLMEEIQKNPVLELAGVYSECGGGVGETPPPEMKNMLEDCVRNGIRLVFMRDTSRVARGFYDLSKRIRLFHEHHIAVWFVSENRSSLHLTHPVPITEIFK